MESHPDFSCNTYELFRYMIKNNSLPGVKYVWILHDFNSRRVIDEENVDYIEMNPRGIINKFKTYYRKYNARCVISCNSIFPKYTGPKDQLHFFLDHGSHLKDVRIHGKRIDIDCDYYFSQSKFFVPYILQQYAIDEKSIVSTGLPRYDQLYRKNSNIKDIVPNHMRFNNIIIWVPTFRKHFQGTRIDCDTKYPYGLPIINTQEDVNALIEHLKKYNCLLIIKPHPAQDLTSLKEFGCENIMLIYNSDLQIHNVQINEILSQTDAMITDYSSIYYDYLELDKPIAITLDDFESYSQQKGFVFEDFKEVIKGEYLYDIDGLFKFIEHVSKEIDICKKEREKVCNMIDDYHDDQSTKRTCDFVIEKLKHQKRKYI